MFPVPAVRTCQPGSQINGLAVVGPARFARPMQFVPVIVPTRGTKQAEHSRIEEVCRVHSEVVTVEDQQTTWYGDQERIDAPVFAIGENESCDGDEHHGLEDPHRPTAEQFKGAKAECRSRDREQWETAWRKNCGKEETGSTPTVQVRCRVHGSKVVEWERCAETIQDVILET